MHPVVSETNPVHSSFPTSTSYMDLLHIDLKFKSWFVDFLQEVGEGEEEEEAYFF